MTPTPRTDAIAHRGLGSVAYIAQMTSLGRELERELADKSESLAFQTQLNREVIEREKQTFADLVTEREQLAANHEATKLLGKWLEQERELADRLAALIKRDRDRYDGQVVGLGCDCCDCEYLRPIDKALAAWKEARRGTV